MPATLQDMVDRISTELQRTDIENEINLAISQAISYYQRVTFYQSDAQISIPTVAHQVSYTLPSDFAWARDVWAIVNTTRYELNPRSYEYLETEFANTQNPVEGSPVDYAIFSGSIYLWPIPDSSTYTTQISYVSKVAIPSTPTTSNFWTTDAEAVIRNRAKAILFDEVLNQPDMAARFYAKAVDEDGQLRVETAMKKFTYNLESRF